MSGPILIDRTSQMHYMAGQLLSLMNRGSRSQLHYVPSDDPRNVRSHDIEAERALNLEEIDTVNIHFLASTHWNVRLIKTFFGKVVTICRFKLLREAQAARDYVTAAMSGLRKRNPRNRFDKNDTNNRATLTKLLIDESGIQQQQQLVVVVSL